MVVEQVRVETGKFGGSNARRESAEEVGDTGSYAIPEDGVKCVGGKNPRGLTTDGVAVEQEGGEEGAQTDGFVYGPLYKIKDKFGGTHGGP